MPVNFTLLFCIPIGILYYFAARSLLRFFLGRYEQKERRAARLFGAFGALSIPLIYCSGWSEMRFQEGLDRQLPGDYLRSPPWGL